MPKDILVIGTYCCGKTARQLAKALDAEYTSESVYSNKIYDLVIRYGNSYAGLPPRRIHVMNYALNIMLASNKPRMRHLLLLEGIPAPTLYDLLHLQNKAPFPLIARPSNHHRGKHFHIVHNMEEATPYLLRGYYFQEIVDNPHLWI